MAVPTTLNDDEFRLLTFPELHINGQTIARDFIRHDCPLDNGRHHQRVLNSAHNTSFNLGDLRKLPLEIIQMIFLLLDLQSLTNLRSISWYTRTLVDELPPYIKLLEYVPDALRALLSTGMAIHFNTQDIINALSTQACAGCGQYATLLDLFTASRFCISCVGQSPDTLSITASAAKHQYGLTTRTMSTLPTLLSLPGQYAESTKTYQKRFSLVRSQAAAIARATQQAISDHPEQSPAMHAHRDDDGLSGNPYRYMSMIRFPFLDPTTERLDWGVLCMACHLNTRAS